MKKLIFLCTILGLSLWLFPRFEFYRDIDRSPLDPTFSEIYNHPFTFIGEGAQMAAFESYDKKVVLKIFKAHHEKSWNLGRFWRQLIKNKQTSHLKWKEKFKATCARIQMAFDELRAETGLLDLHFKASPTPIWVTLKGKGQVKRVDLSELPFVLQAKATLLPEYLASLNEPQLEKAKEQLKHLFTLRTLKGFHDPRQSFSVNYGFIGDTPIQIDVGKIERLTRDPEGEIALLHAHVEDYVNRFMRRCSASL